MFVVSASGASATPLHAFQGITVPLAVLAVQGVTMVSWRRLPYHRAIALTALALVTIPATAYELNNAGKVASPTPGNANFITRDERSAINYLAVDRDPGGVLTQGLSGRGGAGQDGTPRRWSATVCGPSPTATVAARPPRPCSAIAYLPPSLAASSAAPARASSSPTATRAPTCTGRCAR